MFKLCAFFSPFLLCSVFIHVLWFIWAVIWSFSWNGVLLIVKLCNQLFSEDQLIANFTVQMLRTKCSIWFEFELGITSQLGKKFKSKSSLHRLLNRKHLLKHRQACLFIVVVYSFQASKYVFNLYLPLRMSLSVYQANF